MESVSVTAAADIRIATPDSPTMLRSTMSTPKSPSESSDDCEAPDFKCAICLGRLRNKSHIDSCLHEFCFECIDKWSKVKKECPLCQTKFEYVMRVVKSSDVVEKFHRKYGIRQIWRRSPIRMNEGAKISFHSRTTMTPQLQERLVVQQIVATLKRIKATSERWSHESTLCNRDFRNRVYRENLWVQPLSDVTNRFRECSPLFYRENPEELTRLWTWFRRELLVLLPLNRHRRNSVMQIIIDHVVYDPIRSPFFATQLQPYLGDNTLHFIHEFAEYARSPFDLEGYDTAATYLPHRPAAIEEVAEIIESSALPPAPVAGPSGVTRPHAPRPTLNQRSNSILPLSNEETHEILSSSSSDCEVIGTFRPPPPEVIDILSNDGEMHLFVDQNATPSHSIEPRMPHASGERLVNCHDEEAVTPHSERTPDVTSPSFLEASVDRPRLIVKIESGRIKQKTKRRRRRRDTSSSDSSEWDSQ